MKLKLNRIFKVISAITFSVVLTIAFSGISFIAFANITCDQGGQGICYEDEEIEIECLDGCTYTVNGCKATGDPKDCCDFEDPCI
jgi:hypothetical protein